MRKPLFIARQGRRPSGLLGRLVARIMSVETAPENARALELLDIRPWDHLLEVGCGHGRTLVEAVRRAEGVRATGVDFSDVMLDAARRRNSELVETRRVVLERADSARLPYRNSLFTRALSVHTVYFWERPEAHLGEILRVLAPGGRFVLGFRPGDDPAFAAEVPAEIYRLRTVAEVEGAIAGRGFDSVRTEQRLVGQRLMAFSVARKAARTATAARPELTGAMTCA